MPVNGNPTVRVELYKRIYNCHFNKPVKSLTTICKRLFSFFLVFLRTVSRCNLGFPGTRIVDQVGFKLT